MVIEDEFEVEPEEVEDGDEDDQVEHQGDHYHYCFGYSARLMRLEGLLERGKRADGGDCVDDGCQDRVDEH